MSDWNDFLNEWAEKDDITKRKLYQKSVNLIKLLIEDPGFLSKINQYEEFVEFVKEYYIIDSNFLKDNYNDGSIITGFLDVNSEIQRAVLKSKNDLNPLREIILQNQKIHPFIKYMFCLPPTDNSGLSSKAKNINNEIFNNSELREKLYQAIDMLITRARDVNANKEVGAQYSGQWHFFFELLQNARDAKSKSMIFEKVQNNGAFYINCGNSGKRFSPIDIWGISSIGQGHKGSESIGYFGIGFKSVQEICPSPLIFSDPFKIQLNLEQSDYIKWDNQITDSNIINKIEKTNNNFVLKCNGDDIRAFEGYLKNQFNPNFLLFLKPLSTIRFQFDEFVEVVESERKEIESRIELISLSPEQKTYYIKNEYEEKIENLKDEEGKELSFLKLNI